MSTESVELSKEKVRDAFDAVAGDLLAACQAAGEEESRILVEDAADAVFNYLRLPYTEDVFEKIRNCLWGLTSGGGGKYIYL